MKKSVAIIDYSQKIDDAYKNLGDYNPIKKKRKVSIVLDDMIADMGANTKLSELLLMERMLKILLVFMLQSYFKVSLNL